MQLYVDGHGNLSLFRRCLESRANCPGRFCVKVFELQPFLLQQNFLNVLI